MLLDKQVANNSSGMQQVPVGESDTQINCSDEDGLTELEKLLKQKTFSRFEFVMCVSINRNKICNTINICRI